MRSPARRSRHHSAEPGAGAAQAGAELGTQGRPPRTTDRQIGTQRSEPARVAVERAAEHAIEHLATQQVARTLPGGGDDREVPAQPHDREAGSDDQDASRRISRQPADGAVKITIGTSGINPGGPLVRNARPSASQKTSCRSYAALGGSPLQLDEDVDSERLPQREQRVGADDVGGRYRQQREGVDQRTPAAPLGAPAGAPGGNHEHGGDEGERVGQPRRPLVAAEARSEPPAASR